MRIVLFRGFWSRCLAVPAGVLLALACAQCGSKRAESRQPESRPPATAPTVVHAGLQPEDRIDGLDLVVAADGTVHLTWRERLQPYGASGANQERIMYRRGHGDPLRWDPPMRVASNVAGMPQLVVRRNGAHVLAGPRLNHWWLPVGADRWQPQAALLGADFPSATAFDTALVGDTAVIAYLSGGMSGEQAVYALRWRDGQVDRPVPLVRYPSRSDVDVHLIDPVLLPQAGQLLLLWGAHALVPVRATSYTEFRDEGGVYAAWSGDYGARWTSPQDINAGAAARTSLHDIAATRIDSGALALFAAHGLFASQWDDGSWSPPRRLAGYDIGQLSGSAKTFHVAAVQCAGQPLVAWVDGRHQGSDKRWWNPLGGFPWSDSPDWINNDLFVLHGGQVAMALAGRQVTPHRQTPPGSYVQAIAVAVRGDRALLVWAGRARVQKSLGDMGSPPVILQRRVECG